MKIKRELSLFKKIIFSQALLIGCVLLIIFFSSNLIRDFLNKKQLNKEVQKLKEEIKELTEKNNQLINLISFLESPEFLETEARIKLNMKKPGEEIIIVPDNLNQLATASTEKLMDKQKGREPKNNLIKWWQYFLSPPND